MIFLDYASATPVSEAAKQAMAPYFSEQFFNPSAPYLAAKKVRDEYEAGKSDLAHLIGAKGDDLVITSGATEANNLAYSAINSYADRSCEFIVEIHERAEAAGRSFFDEPYITALYLETEHDSIRQRLKDEFAEPIKVDRNGLIDLDDFKEKLKGHIAYVTIAMANNETGTIQPIAEIGRLIKNERLRRLANKEPLPIFFHTDASQALGLVPISVSRLGVDLMTLNSAKVYGPKGVGALYKNRRTQVTPNIVGGGQENGYRSGTENVPGLIGFAAAAKEAVKHQKANREHYEKLVKILREELMNSPIEPIFLGNPKHQLANFCPVSFPGLDAERLIYDLEEDEIYLSTGAACAASKGEKSQTLAAIGLTDQEIAGSLRISLGLQNTVEDMKIAGEKIVKAVKRELSL